MSSFYNKVSDYSLFSAFVLITMMGTAPGASSQESAKPWVGYVVRVEGDWILGGNPPDSISGGRTLYEGQTVRLNSPHSPSSHIIIHLRDGGRIEKRCYTAPACATPFTPSDSLSAGKSRFTRIVSAVLRHFSKVPQEYVPGGARGAPTHALDEAQPVEAVVRIRGKDVDIGPALAGVRPGPIALRLQPIELDARLQPGEEVTSRTDAAVAVAAFHWNPDLPSSVTVPGLNSGLYGLSLSRATSGTSPSWGDTSLVLVKRGDEYDCAAASFQDAQELTQPWNERASSGEIRAFLRRYLHHLAASAAR